MTRKASPPAGDASHRDPRSALLDAVAALLRERGGVEAPVAAISERAQVNAGLIGYYFGGKDGLLIALLERDMKRGHAQLEELLEMRVSVVEKIRIHISGVINLYFRAPYLNQLLLTIIERSSPERARELTDRLMLPIVDTHARLLKQGQDSGELRAVDPMLFYYSVLGACDRIFSASYSLRMVFGLDGVDADLKRRFTDHTIDLLLPGLLAARPADGSSCPAVKVESE